MPQLNVTLDGSRNIASPLRYPGGKSSLSGFVADVMTACGLRGGTYVEPFAGGAGVAIRLLDNGVASKVLINDLDPNVLAFWNSLTTQGQDFLELFDSVSPTLDEWHKQRDSMKDPKSELQRGFAFFFLNRTNRSGVISGGVIGGLNQQGKYKVDARYNKEKLRLKLEHIIDLRSRISVTGLDGSTLVDEISNRDDVFVYADPPYVKKGGSLYMNYFHQVDHEKLSRILNSHSDSSWLLTYDDNDFIRNLYSERTLSSFSLSYSAHTRRSATELLILSDRASNAMR